jgi:predicted nucleic acid-binding protein
MARFVDANVFLRFLLDDHPVWSPACKRLFLTVERGEEQVWTSEIIVSEVVYVLNRVYKVSRSDIAAKVLPLLRLGHLRLLNKKLYPRVFQLYEATNLSYPDCHTAALIESRSQSELYSYDEGFKKVPTLKRLEP